MKISRLASSGRHYSSLSQQQFASAASHTMSRRSSRMLAVHGRSISCSCKLRLRMRAKSSLQKGAFKKGKRTPRGSAHDADPRGVLASAAVLSMPAFARRHKECCKMTYSRMAFSSRRPSSPGAAAGRRDWHQARWVMVEQQWMERSASGRLQLAVGGMIIASAASPNV